MSEIYSKIKSSWYKFCGIIDAIRSLNNRYDFLAKEYHPIIPNFKIVNKNIRINPFDEMNILINDLKNYFLTFNFKRTNNEIPEVADVNSIKFDIDEWEKFNFKFWELISLYEIIKSNFYKRSISLEIPQQELGYHRGLELTTGNEGFTLGGDIITEKLSSSVNLYFKWDGLFSYEIPFEDIYGASFKLFRQFNAFHISLSSELKYFAGNYFLIAHEISHALIYNPKTKILFEVREGSINSYWYYLLFQNLKRVNELFVMFNDCDCLQEDNNCENCPVSFLLDSKNIDILDSIFVECLVDYFATKISGFYYLIAFIDFLPFYDIVNYIRISFVYNLLQLEGEIDENESDLYIRKTEVFSSFFGVNLNQCRQCVNDLTLEWGEYVRYSNEIFIKDFISNNFLNDSMNDLSNLITFFPSITEESYWTGPDYNRKLIGNEILNLMNLDLEIPNSLTSKNLDEKQYESIFKPLFDYLICNPYKKLPEMQKIEIIKLLEQNKIVEGKNPLLLLNIYYEYFDKGKYINYYVFLYSLFKSKI